MRDPPIAIDEGTPGTIRKGTADDHWGCGLCTGLGQLIIGGKSTNSL